MNSQKNNIVRVGIFYDGYYFYKVSNYYKYEHTRKARISISGLHDFIRHEIASILHIEDIRHCQIIDAHYFKGRSSAKEMGEKVQSERVFEDILMRENIVNHYLPLRYGVNDTWQEKGIDVWLALEAYELAIYKQFDVLVLVAGDGDYVPLVRKLNTLGTQVMLICWDYSYYNENGTITETRTSRQLLEEVLYPIVMNERIDRQPSTDIIDELFVRDRRENYAEGMGNMLPLKEEAEAPQDDGQISTIISLKDGFGFIKDEKINNVFFYYDTLTNKDFDELEVGMKVTYLCEEDEERSKRDEAPRYRAYKVTVLD
ncbi:NYN domain-containing protein [Treponema sp. TIM-1]|uniref:NYN domain-containing protein n=1 Tax=Treponema sp. TIM-1 TaxID=2898417 RepID=UPI0039813FB0